MPELEVLLEGLGAFTDRASVEEIVSDDVLHKLRSRYDHAGKSVHVVPAELEHDALESVLRKVTDVTAEWFRVGGGADDLVTGVACGGHCAAECCRRLEMRAPSASRVKWSAHISTSAVLESLSNLQMLLRVGVGNAGGF